MTERETLELPRHVGEPSRVYQDPFTAIDRYEAQFSSFTKVYYVSRKGIRAAVLPIHEGKVLLGRQYRFLLNAVSLEVIGGKVETGEDPAAAASRECLEETGYECEGLEHLLTYQPGLDAYDNPTHVYLSRQVRRRADVDPSCSRWVPWPEIPEMLRSGELCDSLSLIALSTFLLRRPL